MFEIAERRVVPELMDDPDLDPALHEQALRGLSRINLVSNSVGIVAAPVLALARRLPDKRIRVLDVAAGGGQVAVGLWRRAAASGVDVEVHGCDISARAVGEAAKHAEQAGAPVTFFQRDALAEGLPEGYDVTMSSLFLHHLGTEEAVRLLQAKRDASRRLVLVNDLLRDWLGLGLAYVACYGLTRSPVVRFDGPASVRAAFTAEECRALADAAEMPGATFRWRWPFRFLMTWEKSHA